MGFWLWAAPEAGVVSLSEVLSKHFQFWYSEPRTLEFLDCPTEESGAGECKRNLSAFLQKCLFSAHPHASRWPRIPWNDIKSSMTIQIIYAEIFHNVLMKIPGLIVDGWLCDLEASLWFLKFRPRLCILLSFTCRHSIFSDWSFVLSFLDFSIPSDCSRNATS